MHTILKIYTLLHCFVILGFSANAQFESLPEAIRKRVEQLPADSSKVNLLIQLTQQARQKGEPGKGISYSSLALELSAQIHWKRGITLAAGHLALCHEDKTETASSLIMGLKSENTGDFPPDKQLEEQVLMVMSNAYLLQKKHLSAIEYAKRVSVIRNDRGDLGSASVALRFIGNQYFLLGDTTQALAWWIRSLPHARKTNGRIDIDILNNIGLAYFHYRKYDSSYLYYAAALNAAKQSGIKKELAPGFLNSGLLKEQLQDSSAVTDMLNAERFYFEMDSNYKRVEIFNHITLLYINLARYREALEYGLKAWDLCKKLNAPDLAITVLNNISIIYQRTIDYQEALIYLRQAQNTFTTKVNARIKPVVMGNIGLVYLGLEKYDSALYFLQQSIRETRALNMFDQTAINFHALGTAYYELGNYNLAWRSADSSMKLSQSLNFQAMITRNQVLNGKLLLFFAKDANKTARPAALSTLSADTLASRAYTALIAALPSITKAKDINLLQENYRLLSEAELMKGDSGNAYINFKNYILLRDSIYNFRDTRAIAQAKIANAYQNELAARRSLMINVIIIAASLLLLTILSFYFIRKIERSRFNATVTALRQEALNAQINDHFIGNTIDSINYFIRNNEKEKASEYLSIFSSLVRKVLVNSSEKMVLLKDDLALLEDYITLEKLRYVKGPLEYEIQVDKQIDIANLLVPPMIFQVLTENALVHGLTKTAGGKLTIAVVKKNAIIECRVEDNGIGRNIALANNEKRRKSFGIDLAKRLVQTAARYKKQARYQILDLLDTNNNPAGTAVVFTLPYLTEES